MNRCCAGFNSPSTVSRRDCATAGEGGSGSRDWCASEKSKRPSSNLKRTWRAAERGSPPCDGGKIGPCLNEDKSVPVLRRARQGFIAPCALVYTAYSDVDPQM